MKTQRPTSLLISLLILFGLCPLGVMVSEAASARPKPEISLTLIPPSPVSDRIELDIRGSVRNSSDALRTFAVDVYLDEEKPERRLHQTGLSAGPQSTAGLKFRWPTQGQAGRHRLIMKAQSDGVTLRMERPIEIVASDTRSIRRLGGAWVDIYHHDEAEGKPFNAELGKMTDPEWRELVRAMHATGQDLLVITMMFQNFTHRSKHNFTPETYPGEAYYPSKLYPARMPTASADPLETIMDEADKLGMHVMPGIGTYAFFDYTPDSLRWCEAVADELWDLYGHHASFYGWYLSHEQCGGLYTFNLGDPAVQRREMVEFFKAFTSYVKRHAPDKPVMLATNPHGLRGAEETYRQLLPNLDILGPFGFHRMPANDLSGEEAATLLQSLCDEAGCHLWLDLETFVFKNGVELHPRPLNGLISDFRRFPNFEKILHYQFPGMMSSPEMTRQPGGSASVRLYEDYQQYLAKGQDSSSLPVTQAKPVRLQTGYAPQYSGGGTNAVADGQIGTEDYLDPAWQGYLGVDLVAVIDQGKRGPVGKVFAGFLQDTRGGIYIPSKVEIAVSDDGLAFTPVKEVRTAVPPTDDGPLRYVCEVDAEGAEGRFVRVQASNLGRIPPGRPAAGVEAWLFVDEVAVLGPGEKLPVPSATNDPLALIPLPAQLERGTGEFVLTAASIIRTDPALREVGRYLAETLQRGTGFKLACQEGTGHVSGAIEMRASPDSSTLGDEGYRLEVTPDGVLIVAAKPAGAFYACQTLRQLLPAEIMGNERAEIRWALPCVSIQDSPRFPWRGVLLDSARSFHSKQFVLNFIDQIASFKMNVLQWHLTDDEGWRLEIPKYPKLVRPISKPLAWMNDGYYTQADIREIVAYAAARHVMIIPEIEMPGHCHAMLINYPELAPVKVAERTGPDMPCRVVDLGNPQTLEFFQDVLRDVFRLFPSPYVHLGGDEAETEVWLQSARARAKMKELNLEDPARLQKWWMDQIAKFVHANGKISMAWGERLDLGMPIKGQIIQGWRGESAPAIKAGYQTVNSENGYTYFDYGNVPGDGQLSVLPLSTVYAFNPLPVAGLAPEQASLVLGSIAPVWVASEKTMARRLFPRLLAFSEVVWTPQEKRGYGAFLARARAHTPRLTAAGIDYFPVKELVPPVTDARLESGLSNPKPETCLTLIPPSPVTDQITVEIRGAVRNPDDASKTFEVSIYLDEEKPGNLLYREMLKVDPRSVAGIKFLWPTKAQAGQHKVLLVAQVGADVRRVSEPVHILNSDIRSTRRVDGAWCTFNLPEMAEGKIYDPVLRQMTDAQWREMVRGMHAIGMDIIILQASVHCFRHNYDGARLYAADDFSAKAFYPSGLFNRRMPMAAHDPIEAIHSEADKLGMHVFAGVGIYAFFDFTPESLAWHKRVAAELWQRYGHHPSFYGWYISEEKHGSLGNATERHQIAEFFKAFTPYVRSLAPDKPVMLAPNCYDVPGAEDAYRDLLPHLDILCPFAFHRMPTGQSGEATAKLLQSLCDEAGTHLWMDMEVFLFDQQGALIPRTIDGLVSDLLRFPNFEKIVCYQYPGLLTAPDASIKPGGDATVKLYEEYRQYLSKPETH